MSKATATVETTEAAPKPVKAKAKPSANGPACKPQLRILAALAKAGKPLSKEQLAARSKVHPNWIAEYVGTNAEGSEDFVRRSGELTSIKKLVPAKLARIVEVDRDGVADRLYEATAAGKRVVTNA